MIDGATVLRDGAKVGELSGVEASQERVVSLMVGRELGEMYPHAATPPGEALLSVAAIRREGAFEDVSLEVRRREIVALVGLAGHGSFEVARSVAGLPPPDGGDIRVDGRPVRLRSLRDALGNGIGFLAEDRADTILRVRTVRENLALAALEMWSRMGFVDTRREADEADRLIKALSVRCRSSMALAEQLSGGNQQKLALGRWLAAERRLLVLLDPTAGVDVGARADIYKHLRNFAEGGGGVLIATSDLSEALGLADRIVAFYRGRQAATFTRKNRSEEAVLAAITGQRTVRGGMTQLNRRTVGPIVLVVAGAFLAYCLVPRFGTRINIGYFLLQSVPLLLTAVGQTLVILTAGIDLSVGACVTLAGVIASLLMDPVNGGSVPLALAACLGAAVAVGLVNGLLIVRYNLPPFLATLGMTFFLAGINLYLRPVPGGHIARSFQDAAATRWGAIPATAAVT